MPDLSQSVLSLRSVGFVRERTAILNDVSLEIGNGELFCLLGPSGSGKTTLLRIISGLNKPTSGQIEIAGVNQQDTPPYRRNIGFVFQDPGALLPHLSVAKNVAFPFKVGRPRPDNVDVSVLVNRALEVVGLTALANRLPNKLSGGEKQRVALARALVYEPPLLLLDEPLAALDNISKEHLLQYISALRKKLHFSCMYVTHDEREAFRLADRIGILINGQLQQISTPQALLDEPLNADIAKLTGGWNLLTVDYDPNSRVVLLPEGSSPKTIPVLGEQPKNGQLRLGFAIRSAELSNRPINAPDKLISLSGTTQDVYLHNQTLLATIQINNSLVKVPVYSTDKIPSINEQITCVVRQEHLKYFKA